MRGTMSLVANVESTAQTEQAMRIGEGKLSLGMLYRKCLSASGVECRAATGFGPRPPPRSRDLKIATVGRSHVREARDISETESDTCDGPNRVTPAGAGGGFLPEPLFLRAASAGTHGPHRDDAGRELGDGRAGWKPSPSAYPLRPSVTALLAGLANAASRRSDDGPSMDSAGVRRETAWAGAGCGAHVKRGSGKTFFSWASRLFLRSTCFQRPRPHWASN